MTALWTQENLRPWRDLCDLSQCERELGTAYVATIVAEGEAGAIHCDGRATGYWDACEPYLYQAYRSLAAIIRGKQP